MGSSLELQNSYALWQSYSEFIQEKLKDVSLMRAKFEQKLANSKLMAVKDKIEIFLEHAMFEEIQSNVMRAGKLFQQLDEEIAPGLVKATINRINFEKRQGHNEKARELYANAFEAALQRNDSLAVTFIACQYARFSVKHKNVQRAHAIFTQAISNPRCANKVLYLSYINMAKDASNQGGQL